MGQMCFGECDLKYSVFYEEFPFRIVGREGSSVVIQELQTVMVQVLEVHFLLLCTPERVFLVSKLLSPTWGFKSETFSIL